MFEGLTVAGGQDITAENDGFMNMGIVGDGNYVFDYGENFRMEYGTEANTLVVNSGACSIQGRLGQIRPFNEVTLKFDTTTPDVIRTDSVIFEITRESNGAETFELKVLKGDTITGEPPVLTKEDIYAGGTLYQLKLEDVDVRTTGVQPTETGGDFELAKSLNVLTKDIDGLRGDLSDLVSLGENENGSYIKHSDGRLECFGTVVIAGGSGETTFVNWEFPYPFSKPANIQITPNTTVPHVLSPPTYSGGDYMTNTNFYIRRTTATGTACSVRATGFWK